MVAAEMVIMNGPRQYLCVVCGKGTRPGGRELPLVHALGDGFGVGIGNDHVETDLAPLFRLDRSRHTDRGGGPRRRVRIEQLQWDGNNPSSMSTTGSSDTLSPHFFDGNPEPGPGNTK